MLKLWGRINSINVMKILWTLEEIGLPYERIDAGMQFGVVNTDEYRAINPNGRVPTIEEDGFTLFESNTIPMCKVFHGRPLSRGFARAGRHGTLDGLGHRASAAGNDAGVLESDSDEHEEA